MTAQTPSTLTLADQILNLAALQRGGSHRKGPQPSKRL